MYFDSTNIWRKRLPAVQMDITLKFSQANLSIHQTPLSYEGNVGESRASSPLQSLPKSFTDQPTINSKAAHQKEETKVS